MDVCTQCGQCCTNQLVLVTFHDLRLIFENNPSIDLTEKISFFYTDDDYCDLKLLKQFYKPVKILDNESHLQEYYLGLRFHPIPNGKDTCCFYNVFKNECRIHSSKPMACRSYPYSLAQNNLSLNFSGRCLNAQKMNQNQTIVRVQQLHDAAKIRDEFKLEIIDWNNTIEDKEKTLQNLILFIVKP